MKKGIYIRFLIIILITAFLSGTISIIFTATKEEQQVRETVAQLCRSLSNHYSDHPQALYWSQAFAGVRVTILTPDGTVLDDSHTNALKMENHRERKEVQYVRKGSVVTDSRSSGTLDKPFMYAATKMEDGTILRIAYAYSGIWHSMKAQLPVFLFAFWITAVVVMLIAHAFAQKVVRPLEQFAEQMGAEDNKPISYDSGYYEIDKITLHLQTLMQKIKDAQEEAQLQNDQLYYILSNIKEGFILLDDEKKIVLINKSALRIFAIAANPTGDYLIEWTRHQPLIEAVNAAVLQQKDTYMELEAADTIFSVHVSPVGGEYVDSDQNGMTILLVDVGAERISVQQRSEFFTNASHELKTPITTLMGLSEMLKEGTVPDQKKAQIYHRIYTESKRMRNLIADILTISRLESGITEDAVETIDIASIAKDVVQAAETQAKEKQVTFTYRGAHILMSANEGRIRDLLSNLIDNAIKYNRIGGRVDVEISADEKHAIIIVRDNGIGIAKNEQNRVFERFYRADTRSTKLIKGTGLGLSIVKHIVNSYGGAIEMCSNVDAGTEIRIKFPHLTIPSAHKVV